MYIYIYITESVTGYVKLARYINVYIYIYIYITKSVTRYVKLAGYAYIHFYVFFRQGMKYIPGQDDV